MAEHCGDSVGNFTDTASRTRHTLIIVSVITAVCLGLLRNDAILWPLMLASLSVALDGCWQGRRVHHASMPMLFGVVGAVSMASGVIFVYGPGPVARPMIYVGAVLLLVPTVCNARRRRARATCRPFLA